MTETTHVNPTDKPRLSRAAHGRPAAPERILHLGIGNFTRAHQAFYTEHAPDAADWGIAAFTGRAGDNVMLEALAPQDDVYTLIVSNPEGDHFEVISSVSSIHSADDIASLRRYFADPNIAIVTSTVTEAGYMRDRNGDLEVDHPDVAADLAALKADHETNELTTIPAKVTAGLLARRAANAGAITILPCDNLAGNGAAFRKVVEQAIKAVDPSLLDWANENVAWATSMVDRITPRTTDADRKTVADKLGWYDEFPVRTEPFIEWVIQGDFPKGRPAWDKVGAVITDDVTPYEHRKLWLLNGAHTSMAYIGTLLGVKTVGEAIADPTINAWVNEWWDLASGYLTISTDDYRAKLLERFSNPRMHDSLLRIAADGSQKLPVRIAPVAKKALADGKSIDPAARAVAAWILFLRAHGETDAQDAYLDDVLPLAKADGADATRNVVAYLDKELAASDEFVAAVDAQKEALAAEAAKRA